jgi:hypothetical protein
MELSSGAFFALAAEAGAAAAAADEVDELISSLRCCETVQVDEDSYQ